MKEEENPTKKAFNATAFAQFLACLQVGGKQERFALGIPGNDRDSAYGRVNPGDEA